MARDHGFHPVRITRVIQETHDTRTYVLDADFPYRAGQFLTVKACGTMRSYSMSSSPDTDSAPATTVKRVPGGLVSNWVHDNIKVGDVIETTLPAGVFCLRPTSAPLIAFCGGSGITPVVSLIKSALATTDRRVKVLSANRDSASIIFAGELDDLSARFPGRFEVHHHLDDANGFVTPAQIGDFVDGDLDADFYLCGPTPYMELVEQSLSERNVEPDRILVERFGNAPNADGAATTNPAGTVTIVFANRAHQVTRRSGETFLDSARRAGLKPPFSCEAGNCATCIARVTAGEAWMRVNNALDDDEVAEGWVLTCQGEPSTADVTVEYED